MLFSKGWGLCKGCVNVKTPPILGQALVRSLLFVITPISETVMQF